MLSWARKRAMRTDVFCSDTARMLRKQYSDRPFEDVVSHINGKSKKASRKNFLEYDKNEAKSEH